MGRFPFFGKKKKGAEATPAPSSGGKPPLNSAKSEGFLKRSKKAAAAAASAIPKASSSRSLQSTGSSNGSSHSKKKSRGDDSASNSSKKSPVEKAAAKHNGAPISDDEAAGSTKAHSVGSSGGSVGTHPEDLDDHSVHSTGSSNFKKASLRRSGSISSSERLNPKSLSHSTSAIGLDEMIEDRREIGTLGQNVVHIEVPFGKPIEEVYDGVHNGPVLGSGISGMVRLVTHKATGLKYAVKVLDLGLVETPTGLQQLREEIFIMCQLDHPNIVRLEEVYESHTEIYLVQELCLGGELFDRLDEQPDYHYTEAECARLVKQMLSAVRYLHSKGIIHRDLKLENFLFSSVHPDSELKMIDFGLSKHFSYGEVQHEAVGTPYTVAPEVIRGSYDERCDIWAIGVIAFLLLSGEPPFGGCGGPEPLMVVRSNILQGSYQFEPDDIWRLVSPQALQFIQSLLVTDPQSRPTAQKAQQHAWFQEWARRRAQNGTAEAQLLSPNVVRALVNFKEFSDMRKLLCEVLSFTLLPDQIRDLRREFEKMDTDGSGEISLAALKQVLMQNAGAGSLGALTEEEVTDIFDAMRVRKTETRIHWHEFIAAGLSQCSVDDRNLRLAFERLDADHKGYITLDDIMDLMGSDALQSEDAMRRMWGDSIRAVKCQHARITYDDFLLLMKGQTRDGPHPAPHTTLTSLNDIPESESVSALSTSGRELEIDTLAVPLMGTPDNSDHQKTFAEVSDMPTLRAPGAAGSVSAPATPADRKRIIDMEEGDVDLNNESPLSMDDAMPLPPPMSPTGSLKALLKSDLIIPDLPKGESIVRRRSRSLGASSDTEEDQVFGESTAQEPQSVSDVSGDASGDFEAVADVVRDMLLPETDHQHHTPGLEEVMNDKSKSALVVNRRLYRAHRQMRLAVLEASKRFEEQQARHARDVILAQREEENSKNPVVVHGAGLVMRHGHSKQVSSEAIRTMLDRDRMEQRTFVEKATRRSGRGRRKKTKSDMSAMLSMGADDLGKVASLAASTTPPSSQRLSLESSGPLLPESPPPAPRQRSHLRDAGDDNRPARERQIGQNLASTTAADALIGNASDKAKEGTLRAATVPGDFKKTIDPFGSHGKYGAGMSAWGNN
mmetsp:Transcript_15641/g.34203  ORF Transcript_15641/g.34203 Transcript_15641/m.34203 type:complete len:1120 (+) Transcript_15641:578-3937(+)|eukprot:CAMPEP_0168748180 /NCGR_PEP_ID=MMETSP0724-20121128/16042_1 /TAXON_ID=265536 /ORGANISM="Amphiprora sp., Strain CCMP467" /LENGTH=1119 /DNA_ID=CAMNT_0008795999 /DNA_START=548 /DNA_END=3907 /DNA_ORIENTATION=-